VQLVAAGEDGLRLFLAQRVPHNGVVLAGAEDQAQRRTVARRAPLAVIVVHIELDLAEVLVRQLPHLEVDQDVALQGRVVEHQVNVEVIPVECDLLLAGDEGEPFPPLQQEPLEVADERPLQVRLDEPR